MFTVREVNRGLKFDLQSRSNCMESACGCINPTAREWRHALGFTEVNARLHHKHNTQGFGTLVPDVSR